MTSSPLLRIKVRTKDWSGEYEVENGFQAVRRFFQDIKEKRIGLDQVGAIGFWLRSDGEEIPFRIAPALFNLGLISPETYRATVAQLGFTPSDEELFDIALQDTWMAQPMDRTQPQGKRKP